MKQLLGILMFAFSFAYPQLDSSLILSEIMFIPQSGNNEFIELYNNSYIDTINLNGFQIKYYTASADIISDAGWDTFLAPRSYAVVFEGDYDFSSGIYNTIIPANALKLKISDNAFGSTGMSNTSDRPVQLLNDSSFILDQRFYTADNIQGYSEEKINLNYDSLNSNWKNSFSFNGTPGYRNSVSPFNYDLSVNSISCSPPIPLFGEEITLTAIISNKGLLPAEMFNVSIFNDINFDSIPASAELILSEDHYNLNPGELKEFETVILSASQNSYNIIARVTFVLDEDTLNNIRCLYFNIYNQGTVNDLIFNEIMFAPMGGMTEWLELYNRTGGIINLKNMKISDNTSSVFITRQDLSLPADSFVVLAKDSSLLNFYEIHSKILVINLPSLNNSGDDLVLKDSIGVVTDSLSYMPEWGGSNGKSLERKNYNDPTNNQDNWGSSESIKKGTPGRINSLTLKDYDLRIVSLTTDKSYGIIGESVNIICCIKNNGVLQSLDFTFKVYLDVDKDSIASANELFYTHNNANLSAGDSIVTHLPFSSFSIGPNYLIAIIGASYDEDISNNTAFFNFTGITINEEKNDLVINEMMFDPQSSGPEWIEIFNRSDKLIDFKNYSIADNSDTVKVTSLPLIINPSEYIVISSDSSILQFYNIESSLLIKKFPSLNNSGDCIILIDSLKRSIDSVSYSGEWGVPGRSVERIDADMPSNEQINWKANIGRNKGSPGSINSVTEKDYDIALVKVLTIPPYPLKGDDVYISVKVINNGRNPSDFYIELHADTNNDSIPDYPLDTITGLLLQRKDSSIYNFNYAIKNLEAGSAYYIKAGSTNDQDTSNNYLYIEIAPCSPPGSVVINEILPDPDIDNTEFIEIFNLSSDTLSLEGWRVEDGKEGFNIISDTFYAFPPSTYFVLAADSIIINKYNLTGNTYLKILNKSSLGLLNNAGLILLKDNKGNVIDSVLYSDSWYNKYYPVTKNISLERINPSINGNEQSNWGSSKNSSGATPGIQNSLYCINPNSSSGISVYPNPFSPDNDGIEDICIINYELTQSALSVRIKIFDSQGRNVRNISENISGGNSGSVIFNGLNDAGQALRMGIYIIFLEALYENSSSPGILKTVVVVARKLN